MKRSRIGVVLAVTALLASAVALDAEVKTQQKTQVKFEGMLGRVMGLFGGKAAKDGVVQTIAVRGDRKATITETSGTIVDLAEEKVYEIDVRGKSYTVLTFDEIRRRMREAEERARKDVEGDRKKDPNEKEMQVDFAVKETGQRKAINGYDCREVVTTVGVHEKGKTLDQAGGLLMTVDAWMAPTIAAVAELNDFDVRVRGEDRGRDRPGLGRRDGPGDGDVPGPEGGDGEVPEPECPAERHADRDGHDLRVRGEPRPGGRQRRNWLRVPGREHRRNARPLWAEEGERAEAGQGRLVGAQDDHDLDHGGPERRHQRRARGRGGAGRIHAEEVGSDPFPRLSRLRLSTWLISHVPQAWPAIVGSVRSRSASWRSSPSG